MLHVELLNSAFCTIVSLLTSFKGKLVACLTLHSCAIVMNLSPICISNWDVNLLGVLPFLILFFSPSFLVPSYLLPTMNLLLNPFYRSLRDPNFNQNLYASQQRNTPNLLNCNQHAFLGTVLCKKTKHSTKIFLHISCIMASITKIMQKNSRANTTNNNFKSSTSLVTAK